MTTKRTRFQQVGYQYHNFEVTKSVPIPELQCHLYELRHLPSGVQVIYIENDDQENLFCLSFQTLPSKSDGVAHILEHTVLCGSEKFPVKDPFFAMTRRSLNTFMNALTGADFTCYPASTLVPKDFYNLLDVYLDAVFHPHLDRFSFLQEGHRLEFANPTDPNSLLEHKGIVFNEMKGVLTSPTTRLIETMHQALFPDLTYGINSGGNPKTIPDLTYEQLIDFHKTYYHPSRCVFFFYGNLPLEKHLEFIEEKTLKGIDKQPPLPAIPNQPRFVKPRYLHASYPISADEETDEKSMVCFGWLTVPITDQEELLALNILEIALMDTDASPLKRALLGSKLCKIASSHIDGDITEAPWIITCRGCKPEDADNIEDLIWSTLEQIAKEGVPANLVENAIHQLEFHRSEITGDHAPFGLSLFMRSVLLKQHGVDPVDGLKIHTLFDGVHKRISEDKDYLSGLIRKHLLDNTHYVRVVMVPDKELGGKELAEERDHLDKIRSALSDVEVRGLVHQAESLAEFQKKQEEEDTEILPKVTLEDVPRKSTFYELHKEKIGSLDIFHHSCFTNKIIYADLIFDLPHLSEEDLSLANLFTSLLTQLGAGGRDFSANLEYIQAHTGGVRANLTHYIQAKDHNVMSPAIHIHGRALHRKVDKLFALLKDFALTVDFKDHRRLKEVITKHFTALESSLNSNAMRYAINLSASGLDIPSAVANHWYGLDYYSTIRKLARNLNKEIDTLTAKMIDFKNRLLCTSGAHLVLSCDDEMYQMLKRNDFFTLTSLPTHKYEKWKGDYPLPKNANQGRTIASPVAFTGMAFKTISYTEEDSAVLGIAACLFDNLTLHKAIREQGGAYGGGATSNALSGNFYFYSYRDPNIANTIHAFRDSVQQVVDGQFDDSDIEEAKLEIIQGLDYPISPGSRADQAYGWLREGKPPEVRQKFRDRLLATTKEQVIAAVKKYIVPKMDGSAVVSFAGKELLEKENSALKDAGLPLLPIKMV